MGDARHKKSPPTDAEGEEVTAEFRRDVLEALDLNARANRLRRLKRGMPGYLISNRSELAQAIGTDKTMINKIIGPARSSSKVELVEWSRYTGRIREALNLPSTAKISVRSDRAEALRFIASLPDDEFRVYDDVFRAEVRKLDRRG